MDSIPLSVTKGGSCVGKNVKRQFPKPSELAPLSAIKLVDAFVRAGLDQQIISVVVGDANIGSTLVCADDIRMVSFTGGMGTGKAITRIAGLKKMTMDLGGNAPVIVIFMVASLASDYFYREDKPAIINPLGFSNSLFCRSGAIGSAPDL